MLVEQSRKVTWGQELMNRVWPVNTWFPTTQLDAEDHHTFYALCYDFFLAPYLVFFYLKNYLISSPWRVRTRYSFSPSSRRYDDKGDDDHRHHHPVNEIMKEWWTRLRWLNTVLRAVSGNLRDGACFKLDKQAWRRKSNGTQKTISQNLVIRILWYLAEFFLLSYFK